MNDQISIAGTVTAGFEEVGEAFAANFRREGADQEVGAALAVYVRGRCVVDLWGGHADADRTRPWARDTLINVWSASKGVMALAVAILVDQGRLRYDDRVAQHWPEFAAAGKQDITVAQILSHQSGVNGWAAPTTIDDLLDWHTATSRLAAQAPFWPPGTAASYHALTHGFLAGEVVRRVTGQDPGTFIRAAIADPLGADFHVGLAQGHDWRVGEIIPPAVATIGGSAAPPEIPGRATTNPKPDPLSPNRRDWRAAQIPAANGQSSAQGLARIYAALANGGELDGVRIISAAGVDRLRAPLHPGPDMLLGPRKWAAGVVLDVVPNFGPLPGTFGHSGWGGAYGCANREHGVAIGYVMNRMGSQLMGNPRTASLADAVFRAIGVCPPA